jgi:hypothetical protein
VDKIREQKAAFEDGHDGGDDAGYIDNSQV